MFSLSHRSWVTKHPICSKHLICQGAHYVAVGHYRQTLSLLFVPCLWHYSSSLRICLWAPTSPWGWCWAAWVVCAAEKAALHVCSGQSHSNPCLVHTHLAGPCCRKGNHRTKATKTTCFTENLEDAGRAEPPLMLSAISSLHYPSSGEFTCSLFFILETEMSVPPPVLPGFKEMGEPTLALLYIRPFK